MLIRIHKTSAGPQLFVAKFRLHHFHMGIAAVLFGTWALWTDRHDLLNWLLYGRKEVDR